MSAIAKRYITPAEYLAAEDVAEFKSEYFNGETFVMSGASRWHNEIKENLSAGIHPQLKGGPCRSASGDMRVKVTATGLYTYPDLLIRCGAFEADPASEITLLNPTVIFEILSPSTEAYDRGTKFRNYQSITSLREYVLVSQDEPLVEWFTRDEDDQWQPSTAAGLDAIGTLTSVPVRLLMADIYYGIDFATQGLSDPVAEPSP